VGISLYLVDVKSKSVRPELVEGWMDLRLNQILLLIKYLSRYLLISYQHFDYYRYKHYLLFSIASLLRAYPLSPLILRQAQDERRKRISLSIVTHCKSHRAVFSSQKRIDKMFWVYILRCADGSYYTGHTDNLERRIGQYQAGECTGYTAKRRPLELAWSQECATREEALSAERQIRLEP